jgi:predicted MPP superfamily phosphohydrolase
MKLFHETSISLYSKKDLKVCILSDIHFSYRVRNQKLNSLREKIEKRKPDYIFMPGDIVDSNNMIENKAEEKRLLKWLASLGEIAPVLISEGNHDVYKKTSKEKRRASGDKWEIYKNSAFQKKVNSLKNVHYLDNEVYEDENLYCFGLTLSPKTYCLLKAEKGIMKTSKTGEDIDEFLKSLKSVEKKIKNLPKDKLKVALIHSPASLSNKDIKSELSEFDYFISGHMHNGLVIPGVAELWHSDCGVVSPSRKLIAKNTRLSRRTLKEGLIITGAVTTWHESVGLAHNLNALYPSYFTTVKFVSDKEFKEPKVHKRYLRY